MRAAEEIIKEGLRKGVDTKPELRDYCFEHGVPKSTFYRTIRSMIDLGEVKERKLQLIEKAVEANHDEVDDWVEAISQALDIENEDILSMRFDHMKQLAFSKRVAHSPFVLSTLERCSESPIVTRNADIFVTSMEILANILSFEQEHKPPDFEKIIQRILGSIFDKVTDLIEKSSEFPEFPTLRFLGLSGRKEAVEIIFKKIRSNPKQAEDRLRQSSLGDALRKLCAKYRKLIYRRLDNLVQKGDPVLVKLAKELALKIT